MSKFLRIGISALALMFVLNIFAATETRAQGALQEILNRMDQHNKGLSSLKADVTMVKYNDQLDETDTTKGTTIYLPKKGKQAMYARIDWKEPLEESIAVIDKEYTLYQPRNQKVIVGKTSSTKTNASVGGALAFMSMSKAQLKTNYTIKYLGQENVAGGIPTVRLELIPKTATSYKSAELWVDGDGMPLQAKVIERNNDSTTVLLSNLKKNQQINASVFTIDYPKTIKPIKG